MTQFAFSDIETALLEFKQQLIDQGLMTEEMLSGLKVVAQTGDLDAVASEQFVQRMSEVLSMPVSVLDSLQEADYLYKSVLRAEPSNRHQKNLVIDIGHQHTHLAFGKGPTLERSLSLQGYLQVGVTRLSLEDPLDLIDVQLARQDMRFLLENLLTRPLCKAAAERPVFLDPSVYYDLALLEAERENSTRDLLEVGLDAETIDWYLSLEGLGFLGEKALQASLCLRLMAEENNVDSQSNVIPETRVDAASVLRELVSRLIILRSLMERLDVPLFRFGAGGGLQAGMLDALARKQIAERNEGFSELLHARYKAAFPQTRQALENLFPEFRKQLQGRVKDQASITNKLNQSACATHGELQDVRTLLQAEAQIKDGHGFTFVLSDVTRPHMIQIRDGILRAIRSGNLETLVIKNYRGIGKNSFPYFSDEDIEKIRLETQKRAHHLPPAIRNPEVIVMDGPDVLKPSGYTTTQLRIRLRNPETGEFDLPIVDLHICGAKVYRFFRGADHLVYDIREGKDIYKGNDYLRVRFEPEVRPLLEAIETMPEALFQRFTEYRGQTYAYLRQLEAGLTPLAPPLPPADLPAVCHLEQLTRLSELQQALIAEAQFRPDRHASLKIPIARS